MSDDVTITGAEINETMVRLSPALDRVIVSFPEEEHTLALMSVAVYGVYHLARMHGKDAACDFIKTMIGQINTATFESVDSKEDPSYDA